MSGQITNGRIVYERRVKTGEFEHKVATAEISYSIDDGADPAAIMNTAAAHAHQQVHRILGLAHDAPAKEATVEPVADAPRRGRPPGSGAKKPPVPAGDAVMMDVAGPQPAADAKPAASIMVDPASPAIMEDVLVSQPSEISDKDLTAAISRRNEATSNAPAIRVLIGKYTPQDGQKHNAREIAQDKRPAFLAELDKVPSLA